MLKKSIFKTKNQPALPIIKFNGVSLVKEETKLLTFYEDSVDEFMQVVINGESDYPTESSFSGDTIRLHGNGSIRISGVQYSITDKAFYQIINYLGMPIKFCSRLSRPIFTELFNKLMGEQYEKNFTLKFITNLNPELIIGFHPQRKMALPTAYNVLLTLMRPKKMKARHTSFMAGVTCGLTYAVYLVFDDCEDFKKQSKEDYKGPYVWPGVEILFSPVWEVRPTVTACVLGEDYVALDKNMSFKFDLKSTGMNKISGALDTFITNVKDNNTEMVELYRSSFSKKISENVNSLIHKRLPKVINSELIDRNFTGMDASKVLKEISEAGEKQTLAQRRKTLFFIWDILKEL